MTAHSWQANATELTALPPALARSSRIQAYRGRPAAFDLMAALAIEPVPIPRIQVGREQIARCS